VFIETGYFEVGEEFDTHAQVSNLFGHSYKQWYKGLARHAAEPALTIWFPRFFRNDEWDNVLSDDEETIYERKITGNDEYVRECLNEPENFTRLVFAAMRNQRKVKYRFHGLYEIDLQTSLRDSLVTYRREAKRVKTYRLNSG
jgi:hypothetical protein